MGQLVKIGPANLFIASCDIFTLCLIPNTMYNFAQKPSFAYLIRSAKETKRIRKKYASSAAKQLYCSVKCRVPENLNLVYC